MDAHNVLGGPLEGCSEDPVTGWFRDGCCRTDELDVGRHVVCAVMTEEFLAFTRSRGNDLSTPAPEHGFPGLRAGDRVAFRQIPRGARGIRVDRSDVKNAATDLAVEVGVLAEIGAVAGGAAVHVHLLDDADIFLSLNSSHQEQQSQ